MGTTLTWRRHTVSQPERRLLRSLTMQPQAVTKAGLAMAEAAPAPESMELPLLPEDPREKAVLLLRVAAEIEHALMVQYLYGSYSFREPNHRIAKVAVEEMSHLMTVQNLLALIGEPPHLERQDFGPPEGEAERLFPFDLMLEPVSHRSLAKYVVAESPGDQPAGVDPGVMERIRELATGDASESVPRVGTLYALLGVVFGSRDLLLELAATGDDWYVMVNALAAEAAAVYGGHRVHLPDEAFQPGSASRQASDAEWDRSEVSPTGSEVDEFRVHVVRDRREALEALRDIGLQGEGPSPVVGEDSHFRRFYDLFLSFFGSDGSGTAPPPGVLNVPSGKRIEIAEGGSGPHVISHPDTIPWARLADLRYHVLLGSLELYLKSPSEERRHLVGWCFAEMYALSKLARLLAVMPRGDGGQDAGAASPAMAALPFNLPAWLPEPVEWTDLAAAFRSSLRLIEALQTDGGADNDRGRLLAHLGASDERKLAEAETRTAATSHRTKADAARDLLDWTAGAGNPTHSGSSPPLPDQPQGRFWNLRRADLVQVSVHGQLVMERPGGGGDAPILQRLRSDMPMDRPKLDPDGEELHFLEAWIDAGCPDEPASES